MGDKLFQVLLQKDASEVGPTTRRGCIYLSQVFKQFLAGRAEEVVSPRFLQGKFHERSGDSTLDKVIRQIAVVQFETYSEEAESG